MKELLSKDSKWVFHTEQRGVKVSFLEGRSSRVPIVKGDFTWTKPKDVKAEDWITTALSIGARKKCMWSC